MQKVILTILDGWGVAPPDSANAPSQANIPNIKYLENNFPATALHASGINVGLPWWEEGNSEVGHLTIGCGKVIYQYLPRIINEIQNGYFFQNPVFLAARDHVRKYNSRLHLMGLVSSGAVHSYIDHLYALLKFCEQENIKKTYIHAFTDGRDTKQKEAAKFIEQLKTRISLQGIGKIATVCGRSYAMDRDENWSRIEKAYNCMVGSGIAYQRAADPVVYINSSYEREITDEYIEPALIDPEGQIKDNDAVIFFNFREDRAKELTRAFIEDNFSGFNREKINNLFFVGMTRYLENPNLKVAYEPPKIETTLSKIISDAGLSQFKIAETEKYAHITYFFNGLIKEPFPRENREVIQSTGGPYYNKNPEMRAPDIKRRVLEEIEKNIYDFILVNFANPDMIGHTGDIPAAIKAAEVVDGCIGEILKASEGKYINIITADHGNFEEMITRVGESINEHSSNPVPFYIFDPKLKLSFPREKNIDSLDRPGGFLFDIAPTVLDYLGIQTPKEMMGSSLVSNFVD